MKKSEMESFYNECYDLYLNTAPQSDGRRLLIFSRKLNSDEQNFLKEWYGLDLTMFGQKQFTYAIHKINVDSEMYKLFKNEKNTMNITNNIDQRKYEQKGLIASIKDDNSTKTNVREVKSSEDSWWKKLIIFILKIIK